ncbi:MAG: hypothetical protein ACK4VN_00090 [Bacteroidales bacterium]
MQKQLGKSIFLFKTPLQLINALEAKNHYNIEDKNSFFVSFIDFYKTADKCPKILHYYDSTLLTLFNIFFYKNIRRIPYPLYRFAQRLWGYFKLNAFLRKNRKCDILFVGHIDDPWMRYMVRKIQFNKLVLLEDGLATIEIVQRRITAEPHHLLPVKQVPSPRKWRLYKNDLFESLFMKQRELLLPRLDFFTVYNQIPIKGEDSVIENGYEILKRLKKNEYSKSREIWFISQPLVDHGILTVEVLLAVLRQIRNTFGESYTYHYIQHQSSKIIPEISLTGFSIKSFDLPIEIQLIQSSYLPYKVGSISSAALVNLSKLFSENETSIYFTELSRDVFLKKSKLSQLGTNYFAENTAFQRIEISNPGSAKKS